MTVDRIHDTKSAVSDFTDRVADDASPNTAAAVSDDPANAPQIGLSSALGGDDSAGLPSLHAGLSRPVTISFDPPAANSALTGPAVTAPLAAATVTEEFFTGNFNAAPPSAGAGGLVDFDSRGNGGGGTGSGGATVSNGFVASWGASNAYGMTFVINWDRSTANAPANFRPGVKTAVHYFLDHFASPITITLNVGWGEVAGQRMSSGELGEVRPISTSTRIPSCTARWPTRQRPAHPIR